LLHTRAAEMKINEKRIQRDLSAGEKQIRGGVHRFFSAYSFLFCRFRIKQIFPRTLTAENLPGGSFQMLHEVEMNIASIRGMDLP